jgi:DNA-binding transcriptional LysR family regulator
MNLTDLHTFSIVAETGTITSAAKRLKVPKSTVSRRVRRLEEDLETELFLRTARSVTLSQEGHSLYQHVSSAFNELHEAEEALKNREIEPSGTLRITTTLGFGQMYSFVSCIATYNRKYPKVIIELILTNRVVNLVEEGIDIGFRFYTDILPGNSTTMSKHLSNIRSAIYASPAYIEEMGMPKDISEVRGHRMVSYSQISLQTKPWLEKGVLLSPQPVFPPAKIFVDNSVSLLNFALVGAGLIIIGINNAAPLVEKGELLHVLPQLEQRVAKSSIVWVSSKHMSPKVRTFIDHAMSHLSDFGW